MLEGKVGQKCRQLDRTSTSVLIPASQTWWALISLFGRTVGWLGLYSSLNYAAGILAFYTPILYTNASYL